MKIKIQCPAKINLTLKVLNKRPDGFHDIESVMQSVSLYDFLSINAEPSAKNEISLSGNSTEIPYDESNLVYKAVKIFLENTNLPSHKIEIYIEKNIPVSAGLAGGSTDAAGTIFGLNELFKRPLQKEKLHELCAKLGSDLNFCLEGGRKITKPENFGISAKEAYTKFSAKKEKNFKSEFGNNFSNDLEWAVIDDYDELKTIKRLYPKSVMSGSGSAYFIIGKEFKPVNGYRIYNNLKAIPNGVSIKKDLS